MKVTAIFHRFGPYHLARLQAAARVCELTAIELSAETSEYAWEKIADATGFERVTLFPRGDSRTAAADEVRSRVRHALDAARPDVVAIPGWSDRAAFVALAWCVEKKIPAIVMSESTAHDEPRVWWKEWVKRRVVRLFSTALVGGRLHRAYLEQLGLARHRIFTGYDVVDNQHFSKAESRKQKAEMGQEADSQLSTLNPQPYFLASARFIPKKNLPFLLRAYAEYRDEVAKAEMAKAESGKQKAGSGQEADPQLSTSNFQLSAFSPWPLVLLGDGPLRETLNSQLSTLNLHGHVLLPGFIQYDELPAWYARAGAFVHASTTEQWGLVVNEAMAAGLPVIVSERCGCVPELVRPGVNGFTFDPGKAEELAGLMLRLSSLLPAQRSELGAASREIISHHGPEKFGEGLKQAAELALQLPRPSARAWDRALLSRLARR